LVNGNDKQDEDKKQSDEEKKEEQLGSEAEQASGPPKQEAAAGAGGGGPEKSGVEEEETEDFGAMFEKSMQRRYFDEGEIIKGTVVGVSKDHVMVDIGDKSEGQIPIGEFLRGSGGVEVKVGNNVEVLVERREEDGLIRLSKEKAEKRRTWDELEDAYQNERPVPGKVVDKVKGGLTVDIGVRAFLPSSQTDVRPIRNLDRMMGLEDRFQIIKFNRKRGNVVVSRRTVLEREQAHQRKETLENLEKDQVVKGVVKNLTEYGAFIDLGGIDGLLHITDMSYGRIGHPSEIMNVGDEISVKVLRFNKETEKVSLGLKQILPDPWDNVEKKYPVGTIVTGAVVSVTDYGAFVELEKGVEGLVHVSEMSWSKKRVHPNKIVEPDQEVEAKVLDIDVVNRRISLSIKQTQPNPWDMLEIKYPVGSRITGKVRNITNFGVFIGVEEGIDGLAHISDLSWTKRVKHPSEIFKKGDEVEAVVLKIDKDNERFSLGIKQAQPDPWEAVPAKYRPGEDVVGKVVNITDFGVFVELEEGIEGLIHISELSHDKVKDPTELVRPGQEITAEVLNVDISERKIRLSVKALERTEESVAFKKFKRQEGDGTSKLGELIQDKLTNIRMTENLAAKETESEAGPGGEEEQAEGEDEAEQEKEQAAEGADKEAEEVTTDAGRARDAAGAAEKPDKEIGESKPEEDEEKAGEAEDKGSEDETSAAKDAQKEDGQEDERLGKETE